MTKSDQREPLLATNYKISRNYGFSLKAPAEAEHVTVAWATHDPFIYMDTFQGLLGLELFVFSDLK
jgi:hypothetical protein